MAETGTVYSYQYNHLRKEVILKFQVGSMPAMQIVMSVEAFFQDIDFIRKDKKLAHWLVEVRKRKELPVNYDFGVNTEITFNPGEWEDKMKEDKDGV